MKKNLFMRASIVLMGAVLFTSGLLFGTYAKYTAEGSLTSSDSVQVASFGTVKVQEHEAELKGGIYELGEKVVTENEYNKVIPGVDIAKDPYVTVSPLEGKTQIEVSFALYVKVVESAIPETVTYSLTSNWGLFKTESDGKVYKYKSETGKDISLNAPIYILNENKLIVSEKYVGGGKTFKLTFSAWIEQID